VCDLENLLLANENFVFGFHQKFEFIIKIIEVIEINIMIQFNGDR